MILQALNEYYDRKQQDLPPFGFEEKAIPFIIVLDEAGRFVNLEDNRVIEDGKTIAQYVRVPKSVTRSSTKYTPNLLWDHYGYVANQPKMDAHGSDVTDKDVEAARLQHHNFGVLVEDIRKKLPNDAGINATYLFLQSASELEAMKDHHLWVECLKIKGCNLTFRLSGQSNLVCQSAKFIDWTKQRSLPASEGKKGICLVSGAQSDIVRLHDKIDGVAKKPEALAAINNKKRPSFSSYGKDQGFNFPVSAQAAFKYATALNHLLRKSSSNKFRITDTSYVCWAERPNKMEGFTPLFLSSADDDPDGTAKAVKTLFISIHNGAYQASDGQDRFFVLGLSPNSARIVVRYWKTGTIGEFSEKFALWFSDLEMTGRDRYGYPSLKKLLRATALQYKDDNIPSNLPGEVVRAILSGGRLPETLIQAVLRRIRAEKGHVIYSRACAIKAYLNRKYRLSTTNQRELTVSLDKEETRIGYCLGRLFATLEKLQQDAQPGIKATIRDRYYSSASTTPKTVFGTLMRLSTHHLKKLEKPAWRVNAEKRIGEVMEMIADFPPHLDLENQGLFALGYYHQKQDFFTKKTDQGEDK